jgi:hypothetical protein
MNEAILSRFSGDVHVGDQPPSVDDMVAAGVEIIARDPGHSQARMHRELSEQFGVDLFETCVAAEVAAWRWERSRRRAAEEDAEAA